MAFPSDLEEMVRFCHDPASPIPAILEFLKPKALSLPFHYRALAHNASLPLFLMMDPTIAETLWEFEKRAMAAYITRFLHWPVGDSGADRSELFAFTWHEVANAKGWHRQKIHPNFHRFFHRPFEDAWNLAFARNVFHDDSCGAILRSLRNFCDYQENAWQYFTMPVNNVDYACLRYRYLTDMAAGFREAYPPGVPMYQPFFGKVLGYDVDPSARYAYPPHETKELRSFTPPDYRHG